MNKSKGASKRKRKDKKDARIKHSFEDYPNGKKPTTVGITQAMELMLDMDAQNNNREFKAHVEWILLQYAVGNVQVNVPNTNLWVKVERDERFMEIIREHMPPEEAALYLSVP